MGLPGAVLPFLPAAWNAGLMAGAPVVVWGHWAKLEWKPHDRRVGQGEGVATALSFHPHSGILSQGREIDIQLSRLRQEDGKSEGSFQRYPVSK